MCGYYCAKSAAARKALANPASNICTSIHQSCKLQCDLEAYVSPIMGIRRRGVKLSHPGLLPHIPRDQVPALAMGISKGIMNPLHSDDPYGGLTETITFNTKDVPPGCGLTFCLYDCGCLLDLQCHHANLVMVQSDFTHGTPNGAFPHGAIGLAIHTKGKLTHSLGQMGLATLYRRVHEEPKWKQYRGESLYTSCSPINCLTCGEGGNPIPCGEPECSARHMQGQDEEKEEEEEEEEERVVDPSPPPRGLAIISWDAYEDGTGGVENEALMQMEDSFLPLATPFVNGEMNRWRAVGIRSLGEGSYSYMRLHYTPVDASGPSTSSSPFSFGNALAASKTSYLKLRLMCQMRDRRSRESVARSIILRVEEPEGHMPKRRKGQIMKQTQLWWCPFHNHFFTCQEGGSLRDQVDWKEVSIEEAQSFWPETPLKQFLATGVVLFDGKKEQLELQLEDWSSEEYKNDVCRLFGLNGVRGSEAGLFWEDLVRRHRSLVVGGWWLAAPVNNEDGGKGQGAQRRAHRATRAGRIASLPTPPITDQANVFAIGPPPCPLFG